MSAFFKATVAFIEVILYITGVFTADTTINYGGNEYVAQEVSEWMAIVENGASDFVIVTEETLIQQQKPLLRNCRPILKKSAVQK